MGRSRVEGREQKALAPLATFFVAAIAAQAVRFQHADRSI
jgi:hypothetical protein